MTWTIWNSDSRPTLAELEAEMAEAALASCLDAELHGSRIETGEDGEPYCLNCGHAVDPDEPVPTTEPIEPPLHADVRRAA